MKRKDKIKGPTLEYCVGSNEGTAIYLCDETGGTRIAGPKCWGSIIPKHIFNLSEHALISIRDEADRLLKEYFPEAVP